MNRNRFIVILGLALCVSLAVAILWPAPEPATPEVPDAPERIVSMAPGITEMLFAIGAGDRVVGITRYCTYPPEATTRPTIGGYIDPNYEQIVSLEPDVAVLYPYHDEAIARLSALDIPIVTADPRTIDGIHESIRELGDLTGNTREANELLDNLRTRTEAVRDRVADAPRPSVLISAGRSKGEGAVGTVYAAGRGQWYDTLIEAAGGVNAYPDDAIQFPSISVEGIYALDPDVIIEMVRNVVDRDYSRKDIRAEWQALDTLRAVREERVYVLGGDYSTIPGPRYVLLLEDMARVLHPERFLEAP